MLNSSNQGCSEFAEMDFIGYGFGKTALNTAVVNYKNFNNFMVNKQINKQKKEK